MTTALDLHVQVFTSRGIAVIDLNYGGSTGYGRDYRDRLRHRWGEVDVEDSAAAVRYLGERGDIDPERVQITGGSAGGYTTLMALGVRDEFASGASYFGVADLVTFHGDTHKFESHYDDYLVGPWPEARELYRDRSPVTHADSISDPLLLLQGLDDKVVPPSQSEVIVDALKARGIPYAYIPFAGEGHGFRRAENIERAAVAHLSFLAQVAGFELADELEAGGHREPAHAFGHRRRAREVVELTRHAIHVLPEGELERKLKLGRPLRVKLGIDVTAPHIHLGNGIPLQRMRAFQAPATPVS